MCRAHQIVNRFRAHVAREDGNVESTLVIIPLLVLFLIGAQIIAATNPPFSTKASPKNQAKAEAIAATNICLIQIFRLVIILTILFSFNFIFLLY